MRNKLAEHVRLAARPEKRPQGWFAEKQLLALLETYALSDKALNAWCRERELFAYHLTLWKAVFCVDGKSAAAYSREIRILKDENDQLKRAMSRKEKALAELAALLILKRNSEHFGRTRSNDSPCSAQSGHGFAGRGKGSAPGSGLGGDPPVRAHGATLAARCIARRPATVAIAVTRLLVYRP